MTPRLKDIFTQTGASLEDTAPDIPHNFHVLVHLTIGPSDPEGGHDYSLSVCTPTWLDHNGQHLGPIWGRHLLIVSHFDAGEIRKAIENMITQCQRTSWAETSVVLARYFAWEFEDYQAGI